MGRKGRPATTIGKRVPLAIRRVMGFAVSAASSTPGTGQGRPGACRQLGWGPCGRTVRRAFDSVFVNPNSRMIRLDRGTGGRALPHLVPQ